MIIETKFDLDQLVWPISCYQKEIVNKCPACLGKKYVIINGQEFSCPNYCRDGYSYDGYEEESWHLDNPSVVGKINVEFYELDLIEKCLQESYKNKTREIMYMLQNTGIGSGTLWPESRLFATKEEALAEVEKRNKELGVCVA